MFRGSHGVSRRAFLGLAMATGAMLVSGQRYEARGAVTVRLGSNTTSGNPEAAAENFFAKRLEELTKGNLQVKVYQNAVLGPNQAMLEQARNGTLEFTRNAGAYLSAYDKRLAIVNLPYLYTSESKLYLAEDGKFGSAYNAILAQYGFKVIGFFESGVRSIYNRKAGFRTPEELRALNLRIRVQPDPVYIDTINVLGAKAVTMDFQQIYSALQQGVIDGAENTVTYYMEAHHDEIAKYFSFTDHAFGVDPLLVSLKWFNAQSKDIQTAVLQAGREAEASERYGQADANNKLLAQAREAGVKFNQCDIAAFRQAVKPVWDKYGPQFGDLFKVAMGASQ